MSNIEYLATIYENETNTMFTKEKYCAVCGCPFSLPLIRNPQDPDPNEDTMLALSNPYDSRLLPRELTTVTFPENAWGTAKSR